MAQIQYIKHLWENEDKSLREIADITDLDFRTVRKYAYQSNWNAEHLPNVDAERHPVLGKYIPHIDEWLEEDTRQPRKQRHTASRIFSRLQDEYDFEGGYTSVKRYVRKKKFLMRYAKEGSLPLEHSPAHAQIDFGEFKYIDGLGQDQTGHALTVSFPYSNAGFTQVFKGENQECLLEGMKRIFNHIGGVPARLKADNMTTAVAKVLKEGQRVLSDGFIRFKLHYRFEADFCNPAAGNEKGNVENKVGYSRRNFLVPVPTITDFEAFNEQLWTLCEQDMDRPHYKKKSSIRQLWEEERKRLLVLPPHEYHIFRYESARINNYGYVTVDGNSYGITPELAGRTAQLKVYFNRIEIYYEHSLLKSYKRSYGRNEEITDWQQYMSILCKKPGAVEHTRFFNQIPKLWQVHLKATSGKERKTALMLLMEIVQDGNTELCDSVLDLARRYGRNDTESLRHCYYTLSKKEYSPKPLKFSVSTPVLNYNPDLSAYDNLMGGDLT